MSTALDNEGKVRERFLQDTAEHELVILRDDGLYRHLRIRKPGTSAYYHDIVTWPGYLAFVGDSGDYVFSRIEDMFEFFVHDGPERINPDYWAEKLQAPRPEGAERYSPERLRERVKEWFDQVSDEMEPDEARDLWSEVQCQVLTGETEYPSGEHEAHRLLNEFEFAGHRIYDSWEWNLREFDHRFLWCCWALISAIKRYREATA